MSRAVRLDLASDSLADDPTSPLLAPGRGVPKAYSSVQTGPGEQDHIELNSSFLYVSLAPLVVAQQGSIA